MDYLYHKPGRSFLDLGLMWSYGKWKKLGISGCWNQRGSMEGQGSMCSVNRAKWSEQTNTKQSGSSKGSQTPAVPARRVWCVCLLCLLVGLSLWGFYSVFFFLIFHAINRHHPPGMHTQLSATAVTSVPHIPGNAPVAWSPSLVKPFPDDVLPSQPWCWLQTLFFHPYEPSYVLTLMI